LALLGHIAAVAAPTSDVLRESGPSDGEIEDLIVDNVWRTSRHTLFCGDSMKRESYRTLLGGKNAQLVFADLPYNVPITD
jgi:hypothetical protein